MTGNDPLYLNDTIVNFAMSWLHHRGDTGHSIFLESSLLARGPNLIDASNRFVLPSRTREYLKGRGMMVLQHSDRRVFIPCCKKKHWFLFVLDYGNKSVTCYDSMSPGRSSRWQTQCCAHLLKWLAFVHQEQHSTRTGRESNDVTYQFQMEQWTVNVSPADLPKQNDIVSCGVYVIMFAYYLSVGDSLTTSNCSMRQAYRWRRRLWLEIHKQRRQQRRQNLHI